MLEFNQPLANALAGTNTKAGWSAAFIAGLGPTRRMKGLRDGVVFFDVALTGTMTTAGGNITGFGKTSSAAVQLAADLSTGTCVLQIEGNGNYVRGSLGLPGSGADFILPSNPTTTSGVAFAASASIRAPILMPSGTGPAAPPLTADSVVAFRVMDWSNESNVVPFGTATFSVRDPDFVLEQPWMAAEMGDVRIQRVADGGGVVMGTGGDCYVMAGDVMHAHAGRNADANVPLQQLELRSKPYGRWASFPFKKDFDIANDTTILPPHKVELLNAAGQIVDVIELYSTRVNNVPGTGRPINAPNQNQTFNNGAVKPWFTCHMVHSWWSHRPKMHTKAAHFCPGVEDDALDPRNVISFVSTLEAWPVITNGQTYGGLGTWRLAPKWSRGYDGGFDTTTIDPFHLQPEREHYLTQGIGYGYEPASTCTHVWYMAPGGPRADRACWSTIVVTYMSKPDGVRLHGAVPYKELFHHFMMGYFNQGYHYFTDVERGMPIPKAKILNRDVCFQDAYYRGGNENYRDDIENNGIRLLSALNASPSGPVDKYGRRFTNEAARDLMHNQNNAACGAYLYCSPRHALEAAHSFRANILATWDLNRGLPHTMFLNREHNWYDWNIVNMWTCVSSDPRSFTKNEIETLWGQHLESVYDNVYPKYSAGTDVWSQLLRDLGANFAAITNDGTNTIYQAYDSKAFYFGQTLLLMKQTGAWDVMRARSAKCAAALDMIVDCLTKSTAGPFVDANGRGIDVFEHPKFSHPNNAPVTYTNWAQCWPVNGQQDWIRGPDGVIGSETYGADGTNTKHFRAQTAKILKTYGFVNTPKLNQAITVIDGFYNQIVAASSPSSLKFGNRFAMMGFFKTPDYVGPPV